jgi:hypothetical protein
LERLKAQRLPSRISPVDYLSQVRLQMHNRILPAMVTQLRMVGIVDHVQHNLTRTEIEGHIIPHSVPTVTLYLQIEPSRLDGVHAYRCHRSTLSMHFRIGPQPARLDNGRQVVHMGDMVDLRPMGVPGS